MCVFLLQVSSLIAELASAAGAERELSFDEGIEERLCAYSRAVAHFPTAVKEASPTTANLCNKSLHFYHCLQINIQAFQCSSSSGGMVGSTLSLKRHCRKESQIHAHSIQLGSRRLRSYRGFPCAQDVVSG